MADHAVTDTPLRAVLTALGVALVCALLVSVTAVTLRPYQRANLEAERYAQLETIMGSPSADGMGADMETRVVELDSGRYVEALDPLAFDARQAAADPESSIAIPAERDAAGIHRRAKHAVVYILRDGSGAVDTLILPVYGAGYQSTLYGYLALASDANTVKALKFYEQNDTPGMGARIQDPEWEALWPGKRIEDAAGALRIGVARGAAPASDADYKVDGISGATRTSLGVDGLLRFWLGDMGFGPYLERVRRGEG